MNSTSLGSLLATRLDAVLGTTLAQHPVLLDGTRSNAAQPASALHGQETTIRRATGEAGEVTARAGQTGARQVGGQNDTGAAPGQGQGQASARTLLSEPARTILALLLSGMSGKTVVQGRLPLLLLPALPTAARLPAMPPGTNAGSPAGTPPSSATAQAGAADATATGRPSSNPAVPGSGSAGQAVAGGPSGASAAGAAARGAVNVAGTAAGPATAASGTLPSAPAHLVATLTTALQRTVSQSGLFYESHLSQMAFGQRSPAEVAREPQARLSQNAGGSSGAPPQPGATGPGSQPGGVPSATANPAGSPVSPFHPTLGHPAGAAGPGRQTPSVMAAQAAAAAMAPTMPTGQPLAGLHPDAAQIVRQQLELLANQMFAWQGEAWNGVPMQWEIRRRQAEEGGHDPLPTWATRLQLQLPNLGAVEARLSLAGDQLVLRLGAPESAPLLQTHLDVLRERLSQQGLQLTDTTVSHESGPRAATA